MHLEFGTFKGRGWSNWLSTCMSQACHQGTAESLIHPMNVELIRSEKPKHWTNTPKHHDSHEISIVMQSSPHYHHYQTAVKSHLKNIKTIKNTWGLSALGCFQMFPASHMAVPPLAGVPAMAGVSGTVRVLPGLDMRRYGVRALAWTKCEESIKKWSVAVECALYNIMCIYI